MAPWEVTRVFPRGLTFFPTGPRTMPSNGGTIPITTAAGITWFTYDAARITSDSKIFADAAEGWLAHADQGAVFIKKFADLPSAQIALAKATSSSTPTGSTPISRWRIRGRT